MAEPFRFPARGRQARCCLWVEIFALHFLALSALYFDRDRSTPPVPFPRSPVLQLPRRVTLQRQHGRRVWWCSLQRAGLENDVRLIGALFRGSSVVRVFGTTHIPP